MNRSGRIIGIDLVRSVAICGAMLSHVVVMTDLTLPAPAADHLFRIALQTSAPIFIVLFGTMLELAYRPKFVPGGRAAVAARLIARALQCWALYALSIVALIVAWPDYSLPFGVATMLFMGVTPFTDILKFYAVVLAIAPLLLIARNRLGLWPLALAAILLHATWPLARDLPSPATLGMPQEIDRLAKFMFEVGAPDLGGPSVIRGLSFVVAGMVLGRVLTAGGRTATALRERALPLAGIAAAAVAVLALLPGSHGPRGLADMTLRQIGHPIYYLFNLPVAVLATTPAVAATAGAPEGAQARLRRLTFFGRTSLFTFAFGNTLLYLTPRDLVERQPLAGSIALIAAITLMSWQFDRLMAGSGPIAARVRRVQAAFAVPARRIVAAFG